MILDGEVEVSLEKEGETPRRLSIMRSGEFFGELALLGSQPRTATVRALTPLTVLALRGREFHALVDNIPSMRSSIQQVMDRRIADDENSSDLPVAGGARDR
jgi:CRP-like cAMP-binding protein